jgi:hypothetical protein
MEINTKSRPGREGKPAPPTQRTPCGCEGCEFHVRRLEKIIEQLSAEVDRLRERRGGRERAA